MKPYIYGEHRNIHIINLERTLERLIEAQKWVRKLTASGNRIMFVGTKKTAKAVIRREAERAGMPYVDHRWLGGMLTNYKTIRATVNRYKKMNMQMKDGTFDRLTKKESLRIQREIDKLERNIGGIKRMNGLPDALFVVDVKAQRIAVEEANKLGIPVIAMVDTNASPEGITFVLPCNDDSIRATELITRAIADACIEGQRQAREQVKTRDIISEKARAKADG